MNSKKRVLYLSYTGLLEPLGRSQVLAYLSRLSDAYQFTIVSFEKSEDFANTVEVENLRKECASFGINWQPKIYHKKPRLLATLWDVWVLFYTIIVLCKKNKFSLIHARSYVTSSIAYFAAKFTKVPFIFDMRAVWVEELIAADSIQRGTVIEKGISWLEKKSLFKATHIVSLTSAAIPFLTSKYKDLPNDKFSVIPTCVDLNRFCNNEQLPSNKIKCVGTMGTVVSGRYQLKPMLSLFKYLNNLTEEINFKIISKDSQSFVNSELQTLGIESSKLNMYAVKPIDIASHVAEIDFAVVLFTPGDSTLGSSPTRIAEFLACGIPVLVSENVGDTANIISEYNVGIAVDVTADINFQDLWGKMKLLKNDPELSNRCIAVANNLFSADKGAENYRLIYKRVIS